MKKILILCLLVPALAVPAQAGLAVKNFRQIYDSLVVSTGVSPTDSEILTFYRQSYTRLPMTGDINEVSSSGLLTLTALSGLFCKRLVTNEAKLTPTQRRALQAVDFKLPPSGLTPQIQKSVIEGYFGIFLSRSPSTDELRLLTDEFTEAVQAVGTTPADTPTPLMAVCTSVASSLDSLLL